MAYFGNESSKIEGYRKFWARSSVKRPLVGFTFKSWLPVNEYTNTRSLKYGASLEPKMLVPKDFFSGQDALLHEGNFMDDDIIRGACPHQGIPWSCGMIGATLKVLIGSILAEDMNSEYENMKPIATDMSNPWFRAYIELIESLVEHAQMRYPVSHGPEVGPSDLAVVWRGHTNFIYDLFDSPQKVAWLLEECRRVFCTTLDAAWEKIPLWENGYYDAQYYLWAPGPICRMQEDAIMLFSPDLYDKYLKPIDVRISRDYSYSFFHLHSTSMPYLENLLAIDTIHCYEVNNDVGGPALSELMPYIKRIQDANKPVLFRGQFTNEEMTFLLEKLDPRGLFLHIMVSDKKDVETLRSVLRM